MGFRDTFTKDDQKEGLLGYDDTAFYFFAGSVLCCVLIPWTFSLISSLLCPGRAQVEKDYPKKSKAGSKYRYCQTSEMVHKSDAGRKEARRCTTGAATCWLLKSILLSLLWAGLYATVVQIGQEKEISKFDPFEILEVGASADNKEIKKSYRKLSLTYHPDKNPDDPLAASRFIQITKAYQALTDEVAKRNYEKYGNPDGPTTTKVGIGLPQFLLAKENQLTVLFAFFFILLFVVPMTFILYYQRTKNYAANGVMVETLQFAGYFINEATRMKMCPELLAASAESRNMPLRPSDNADMTTLMHNVTEHKKRQFNLPIIMRNQFIVWAHMQRLHSLMSANLKEDCGALLKYSMKITQAMAEIACMREWFFAAQSMIEFRRCLVQALDVKGSSLLQIPHFTEEILKHCVRGKNAVTSLGDYLSKDEETRKGFSRSLEPAQQADIQAFCQHVSDVELKAHIEVEDEDEFVVGDVATVTVQLVRKNLKEGEAAGPVHAPFFPEPKFEEWWIFLVEAATTPRIIAFERLRDTERVVEEKLRFQVSRPGKYAMIVHALCDSYAGIDQKVELNFAALTEDEVKRDIIVHREDEELDLQPTLFQQFMGELNHDEESEEEEEEETGKKKNAKAAPQAAVPNLADEAGEKDAASPEKSGAGDGSGDDSSDSSSDSEDD